FAGGVRHAHVAVLGGGRGLVIGQAATQGHGVAELVVGTDRRERGVAVVEVQHRVGLVGAVVDGHRVERGGPGGAGHIGSHRPAVVDVVGQDRKSTRLNSSHV